MRFKKKLISATLSLVVATVLMASSSYAWFTISTNPEISKIKTSITANENIEIALDNGYENAEAIDAASAVVSGTGTAGNPYTWGNLLDMTTAMTNIGANISLKPVGYSTKTEGSETKVVMKTPQYGLDGRVAKLVDMAQEYISAYDGVTTPSGGISIFKQTEDTDEADALALSFWLRANADVSLMLSEGTYRADDGTNTAGTVNAENGGGSRLILTVPDEAVEKAVSIQTQVNELLSEMSNYVNNLIIAIYDLSLPTYNAVQYLWNTCFESLKALLSENMANLPVCYTIRYICTSQNDQQEYSLDEMNELMNRPFADYSSETMYGFVFKGHSINPYYAKFMSSVGIFEADIALTPQMLRLLDKLKIRFVVSSDEGTQELYAKISPAYYWQEVHTGLKYLPDEYNYIVEKNGVTYGDYHSIEYETIEHRETAVGLSNGNQFCFQLCFYDKNDTGFSDYQEKLMYRVVIDDEYPAGRIGYPAYLAVTAGAFESPEDVYDDYMKFLYEVCDREIQECLEQLPHIDLSANKAKKVDVYMYLDGEAITNADAVTIDGLDLSLNIQFEKIGGATNAMTGRVYEEEESSSESE